MILNFVSFIKKSSSSRSTWIHMAIPTKAQCQLHLLWKTEEESNLSIALSLTDIFTESL